MKVSLEKILSYHDCCSEGVLNFKKHIGTQEIDVSQVFNMPIPLNDIVWYYCKELPLSALFYLSANCAKLLLREQNYLSESDVNRINEICRTTFYIGNNLKLNTDIATYVDIHRSKPSREWYALAGIQAHIVTTNLLTAANHNDTLELRDKLYTYIITSSTFVQIFDDLIPEFRAHLLQLGMAYKNKD